MVFRKCARRLALTVPPGGAEHMFCNDSSVMGCLESKYLHTLHFGRPQLEPIKRCQPEPTELLVYRPLPTDSCLLPGPAELLAASPLAPFPWFLVLRPLLLICPSQENAKIVSVAPVLKLCFKLFMCMQYSLVGITWPVSKQDLG